MPFNIDPLAKGTEETIFFVDWFMLTVWASIWLYTCVGYTGDSTQWEVHHLSHSFPSAEKVSLLGSSIRQEFGSPEMVRWHSCKPQRSHWEVPAPQSSPKIFANVSLPCIPHSQKFTWGQMEEEWRKIIFLPLGGPSLSLVSFLLTIISFQV